MNDARRKSPHRRKICLVPRYRRKCCQVPHATDSHESEMVTLPHCHGPAWPVPTAPAGLQTLSLRVAADYRIALLYMIYVRTCMRSDAFKFNETTKLVCAVTHSSLTEEKNNENDYNRNHKETITDTDRYLEFDFFTFKISCTWAHYIYANIELSVMHCDICYMTI